MKPDLQDSNSPIQWSDIRDFERDLPAGLPDEYADFLLRRNGGVFHDDVCHPSGVAVREVYGLNTGFHWSDLRLVRQETAHWMPAEMLPIASGPLGDEVCLNFTGRKRGRVFVFYHDMIGDDPDSPTGKPKWLAEAFPEFLASLVTNPNVDLHETDDVAPFRAINSGDV
jgi:hypothetical protein